MAGNSEEGTLATIDQSGDPRPDLPRIALDAPLAGHWVKIDTSQLRMADFVALEHLQTIASTEGQDGAALLGSMTKLLKLVIHVVVATSLPGETIAEAIGELRPAEFSTIVSAMNGVSAVPKAS